MYTQSEIRCDYQWDDSQQAYICSRCGDKTTTKGLHRVCPVLRKQRLDSLSPEELRRLEICRRCPNYFSEFRCKKIDLGCKHTFQDKMKSDDGCPIGRWVTHSKFQWAYGVTTVPSRIGPLLYQTLDSLSKAGFPSPRIFVDGAKEESLSGRIKNYPLTCRYPKLRTFGNWILALWELYVRLPSNHYFALFQDDCVAYRNLRSYLEQCNYPNKGYWNLYTFPENTKSRKGWYQSNQRGLGAVGLVFSNEAVRTLLRQQHIVDRPLNPKRGWKAIDGGIVTAMKREGFREYVHNPSLLQHTGIKSSMGNGRHPEAPSFLGEEFNALDLLGEKKVPQPVVISRHQHTERIGLVGYCCDSGLGTLNQQIAQYIDIAAWLIKPHRRLPTKESPPTIERIVCGRGTERKINKFLDLVDTVLFCETPYFKNLIPLAKKRNKRIVCVPMMEWMPAGGKGWPRQVDLFICPTQQCYDLFKNTVPCAEFQWPTDTSNFPFRLRTNCERFLFVNGMGGYNDRKGSHVIQKCLEIWPEMPLLVRSQANIQLSGSNVQTVIADVTQASRLYELGDICLIPSCVDGLGLTNREAMSSGLPVFITDGLPWIESFHLEKIPASVRRTTVNRPVDWYDCDPQALVQLCKKWLNKDITKQSQDARLWAESIRWQGRVNEFTELVRTGKHKIALPFQPKETAVK